MKSLLLVMSTMFCVAPAFADTAHYEETSIATSKSNTTSPGTTTLPVLAAGLVALGIARHRAK